MFSDMGFSQVRTYIQSGNVVFDTSKEDEEALADRIAKGIRKSFGYDLPIIVKPIPFVKQTLEHYPFVLEEGWKGYITFLAAQPLAEQADELESLSSEIETFKVGDAIVYSAVDKQTDQKPLFSNSFVEQKLGVPATTRNLRTAGKIIEMAHRA